jgi:hypothetical protein
VLHLDEVGAVHHSVSAEPRPQVRIAGNDKALKLDKTPGFFAVAERERRGGEKPTR